MTTAWVKMMYETKDQSSDSKETVRGAVTLRVDYLTQLRSVESLYID